MDPDKPARKYQKEKIDGLLLLHRAFPNWVSIPVKLYELLGLKEGADVSVLLPNEMEPDSDSADLTSE